jgi:hypothetical protein
MRYSSFAAGFAALLLGVASANAQLLYSYEVISGPGPDGFFGLGAAVSQDTIGATEGTHSMKYLVPLSQVFVGARTETVIPAGLFPPPPAIGFDLTIANANDEYSGAGAARIGITFFGHDIDNGMFGLQVQTNGASEQNIDLGPGTYAMQIPLFAFGSDLPFSEIFDGDDPADLDVVSAFQFYINKGNDSGITVYIDNVRAVPEPTSMLGALGGMGLLTLRRRARA